MSAASKASQQLATSFGLMRQPFVCVATIQLMSAYVSNCQHTSAYLRFCDDSRKAKELSIRQHTSAYVSVRQSAYGNIRQHTSDATDLRFCGDSRNAKELRNTVRVEQVRR